MDLRPPGLRNIPAERAVAVFADERQSAAADSGLQSAVRQVPGPHRRTVPGRAEGQRVLDRHEPQPVQFNRRVRARGRLRRRLERPDADAEAGKLIIIL